MRSAKRRGALRFFRIVSLPAPSALAWEVASSARGASRLTEAVAGALAALWLVIIFALFVRAIGAGRAWWRDEAPVDGGTFAPLLDRLDLLTASGSAMIWTSAAAIASSVWVGWASLAIVGSMGIGVVHLVVLWTCLRTSGDWLGAGSVRRAFVPARVVEGEAVREELELVGVRLPIGFRLFATGLVGARWPRTRYVVEEAGDVALARDLGPAFRGEHEAPPLEIWLQDIFGLCRTPRIRAGAATLSVMPRPRLVDLAMPTLAAPGADREPVPSAKLPTEGTFRLREYQPGDDARRIHWVRSLVARELVVRMPDEVLPDRPAVDLVLDTFLPGVDALRCDPPACLLDALVSVWLGVGRALVRSGARVTLVTAARSERGAPVVPVRTPWPRTNEASALRVGARAAWQAELPASALVGKAPATIVSCRLQEDVGRATPSRWILVPREAWTCFEATRPPSALLVLPHPMGSADNRRARRREARRVFERARRDHEAFAGVCADLAPPRPCLVARPAGPARAHLEVRS